MREVSAVVAHQWHCDHFGHMNVRHYAAAFDDATFLFWAAMGHRHAEGVPIPVTLETATSFRSEVRAGAALCIGVEVTKVGTKSVGLQFQMRCGIEVMAACKVVEVFMDPTTRQSCAIPDDLRAALVAEMAAGHPARSA